MARILVTGATGYVGSNVARALRRRGDEVVAAVRPGSPRAGAVDGLESVDCDLTDPAQVRRAVRGIERIVNAAGPVSLRERDRALLFRIHRDGTRNLLEAARAEGVGRVVHVSAAVTFGPAPRGTTVDETHLFDATGLDIPYVRAKRESEVEALRFAAKGMDVVCVNPAWIMGPGDLRGQSTAVVAQLLAGVLPGYVDGAISIVDVRDVAEGVLLAEEKGRTGERYILGGRNFTLDRLVADLARIGRVAPPPKVALPLALATARAAERLGRRAPITYQETIAWSHWWTYRSAKAVRDLSFRARPHEETLEDTVAWITEQGLERVHRDQSRLEVPLRTAARAFNLLRGDV